MARRRAPAPENDPSRPVRIFVSSTSKDLGDVHRRVVENLEASYGEAIEVVTMGRFTTEPEPSRIGDVEKALHHGERTVRETHGVRDLTHR